MGLDEALTWPFFDDGASRACARRWHAGPIPCCRRCRTTTSMRPAARACARWPRPASSRPWCRLSTAGSHPRLDVRTLCLAREHPRLPRRARRLRLRHAGPGHRRDLAVRRATELKPRYLPPVRDGEPIAAFALSEPEAGSDVAALATTATPRRRRAPAHRRHEDLDLQRRHRRPSTWSSRAPARRPAPRALSAFVVDAGTPGLEVAERIEVIAPHPLARRSASRACACRRPTCWASRATASRSRWRRSTSSARPSAPPRSASPAGRCDEALDARRARRLFGAPLAELQMTQAALADMATRVDAAALLVYRAAWAKDQGAARVTREAAMAKLFATEAAQRVIDRAVQLHGGLGVTQGRQGRGALPRDPGAAHLRRRDRGAEARHRARA